MRDGREPKRPLGRQPAVLALVVGLVLTVVASRYAQESVRATQRARFEASASAAQESLTRRIASYLALLRGGAGLFAASELVTRDEFRRYVRSLELATDYPGLQGFGYAALVGPEATPEIEQGLRELGLAEGIFPPGDRKAYAVIVQLEPPDERNLAAIGFDMYSEPTRRAAMDLARDTGRAAVTGPVTLVQEITEDKQPGFLIYQPVYARGAPLETVEQRRAALLGFVYVPVRTGDFLGTVFSDGPGPVSLEIYDGDRAEPATRFWGNGRSEAETGDFALRVTRTLELPGRRWTLAFAPGPRLFDPAQERLPLLVLVAGLLASGLLYGLTERQIRGRAAERQARAEADRARRHAELLAEASRVLAERQDPAEALGELSARLVPALGDLLLVDVLDAEGRAQRLVVACADPADDALAEALRREPVDPLRVEDAGGLEPEVELPLRRRAHALGALVVPLRSHGALLGRLVLLSRTRTFLAHDERELVAEVGRRAALAVENTRLLAQTREAVLARDQFLSIASHELRTPLTTLQATVQVLRRRLAAGERTPELEEVARKLEPAERQIRRLGRLINDLLDVSRIGAGRLELERESFDLRELATDVVARLEDEAQRTGAKVRLVAPEALFGEWDRGRLEQVLVNLLVNALKYGDRKPVDLELAGDEATVRIEVRDRGIGIAPELQPRIFERFERAVSGRHYGGLGLGLFIVREIVEAHGGRVGVSSAPGEGSTFRVELPRAWHPRADEPAPRSPHVP